MAWTKQTTALTRGTVTTYSETITLPSTGSGYTSEIDFVGPKIDLDDFKVLIDVELSGVAGTNVDVNLIGKMSENGTRREISSDILGPLTSGTLTGFAIVDLNSFPAVVYEIGFDVDADNSGNTATIIIGLAPK